MKFAVLGETVVRTGLLEGEEEETALATCGITPEGLVFTHYENGTHVAHLGTLPEGVFLKGVEIDPLKLAEIEAAPKPSCERCQDSADIRAAMIPPICPLCHKKGV